MIDVKKIGNLAFGYIYTITHNRYFTLMLYGLALVIAIGASVFAKYNFWEAFLHTLVFFSIGVQGLLAAIYRFRNKKKNNFFMNKQNDAFHGMDVGMAHLALSLVALLTLVKTLWAAPVAVMSILLFAASLYTFSKGSVAANWSSFINQHGENSVVVYTSIATVISLFLALLLG